MNLNLIKSLSDQAKESVPKGILSVEQWIDQYNQKFVELVIQECLEICDQGVSTQTTSSGAADLIKHHFGITND